MADATETDNKLLVLVKKFETAVQMDIERLVVVFVAFAAEIISCCVKLRRVAVYPHIAVTQVAFGTAAGIGGLQLDMVVEMMFVFGKHIVAGGFVKRPFRPVVETRGNVAGIYPMCRGIPQLEIIILGNFRITHQPLGRRTGDVAVLTAEAQRKAVFVGWRPIEYGVEGMGFAFDSVHKAVAVLPCSDDAATQGLGFVQRTAVIEFDTFVVPRTVFQVQFPRFFRHRAFAHEIDAGRRIAHSGT